MCLVTMMRMLCLDALDGLAHQDRNAVWSRASMGVMLGWVEMPGAKSNSFFRLILLFLLVDHGSTCGVD